MWEKDPEGQRRRLLRRAEKNLFPPYAWEGNEFFGHKETSCFAYVNQRGKHRAELTGINYRGVYLMLLVVLDCDEHDVSVSLT